MVSRIIDFFGSIGNGVADFFGNIFDTTSDIGTVLTDGITNVLEFLKNSMLTLYELVNIFPIECRVLLLTFISVSSAYLIYKVFRGG